MLGAIESAEKDLYVEIVQPVQVIDVIRFGIGAENTIRQSVQECPDAVEFRSGAVARRLGSKEDTRSSASLLQ